MIHRLPVFLCHLSVSRHGWAPGRPNEKNRKNTGLFDNSNVYADSHNSGDDGIRTRDLSVANAALSQLSYVPI